MSDDNDKTRFQPQVRPQQPGSAPTASAPPQDFGDRTMMIPRPGGSPVEPTPQPVVQAAPAQPQAAAYTAPAPQPLRLEHGLNPLVTAAATLLAVLNKLRNTLEHPDVAGLHRQLVQELRQFEQQAKNAGVRPELAITARYQLCTALDETVMNTPWGAAAGWSQRSLLSLFHNETFGGEKFFTILGRLLETPAQNLDALELVYLLLSLGFEGKYRIDARGRDQLEVLRDNLYRTIEQQRGAFAPDLSPNWRNSARQARGPMHFVPLWVIGVCALAVLLLCFSGFRFWLHQSVQNTTVQLQQQIEPVTTEKPQSS